jgi:hypothetical protein
MTVKPRTNFDREDNPKEQKRPPAHGARHRDLERGDRLELETDLEDGDSGAVRHEERHAASSGAGKWAFKSRAGHFSLNCKKLATFDGLPLTQLEDFRPLRVRKSAATFCLTRNFLPPFKHRRLRFAGTREILED